MMSTSLYHSVIFVMMNYMHKLSNDGVILWISYVEGKILLFEIPCIDKCLGMSMSDFVLPSILRF